MIDQERAVLVFLELAWISARKGQGDGRDRFLSLAGMAACRAGMLTVAGRCHALILNHNPKHLIHRYADFPQALKDRDFHPFELSLERFCSFEHAEHLLAQQSQRFTATGTIDEQVAAILATIESA